MVVVQQSQASFEVGVADDQFDHLHYLVAWTPVIVPKEGLVRSVHNLLH